MSAAFARITGVNASQTDPVNACVLSVEMLVGGAGTNSAGTLGVDVEVLFTDSANTLATKVTSALRTALTANVYSVPNGSLIILSGFTKA